jgi:hypothetical protein
MGLAVTFIKPKRNVKPRVDPDYAADEKDYEKPGIRRIIPISLLENETWR